MPSQDRPFDLPGRSGDDEELVRDFRSGCAQALGVIFARYYRLVFATAWRVLRDVGEAEDLAQSVFFEISRKASHFDPAKGPLNKWILTLAYHRSLNRKSYLMTRQFYKGHLDLIGENGEELWSTSLRLPAQEAARLVHECLGLLDPRQRQVLELVFFKELTFKEIAERTQQTFGNVRNQYYRSLKRLRAHLTDSSREDRSGSPERAGFARTGVRRRVPQSQDSRIAPPLRAPSVPQSLGKEWAGNLEWRREALAAFERVGAVYFEIVPGGVARIGDLKMSS
jgi:RNA polymerase sigma-70 factor (ECF subfamily)